MSAKKTKAHSILQIAFMACAASAALGIARYWLITATVALAFVAAVAEIGDLSKRDFHAQSRDEFVASEAVVRKLFARNVIYAAAMFFIISIGE